MVARLTTFVLLIAALIAGAAWTLQRKSSAVLREQLTLLRSDRRELAALRAENETLKQRQPSEKELSALRADHAAAARLRTELNTLREQIAAAEAKTSSP